MRRTASALAAALVLVAVPPGAAGATAPDSAVASPPTVSDDHGSGPTIAPEIGMGPGRASRPAPGARLALRTIAGTAAPATGFRTTGTQIFPLLVGSRPYEGEPVLPLGGTGVVDGQGVRMFRLKGDTRMFDHPAAQAAYALHNLDSYRTTHQQTYLDRAVANAQRLVDRRVESGGGWFFPYGFTWTFYGSTTLTPPWYSAIAQGQALSAFVRLFEATGDPRWRTAADATFHSLDQAPVAGAPFATWVDGAHHLWLEEYPQPDIVSSEKVLNGHLFASFGLVDYWNLTHDPRAALLFDGAVTTIQETALNGFRHPGAPSSYSLRHRQPQPRYHHTHVLQFRFLYELTHRGAFVAFANTFRNDWPQTWSTSPGVLTRKLHRVFRVERGVVTGSRVVRLKKNRRSVQMNSRVRVPRRGVMVRIASGRYAGWYAKEHYGRAWMARPTDVHLYAPRKVTVGFLPGTYVGHRYWSTGTRRSTRTLTFGKRTTSPSGQSAFIGGQPAFLFTSGSWAGYWVPLQSGMVYG
jgi:hypothetical protein